jgi:membrane-associated HD superfamily phosphohydrolase
MLADGCEARARSERPKSEADIDRLVKSVMEDRQATGQLDDTGLTVRDLSLIRESFVSTLKGVFHPRLEYPADTRPALPGPVIGVPALPPAPSTPPPEQRPEHAS